MWSINYRYFLDFSGTMCQEANRKVKFCEDDNCDLVTKLTKFDGEYASRIINQIHISFYS